MHGGQVERESELEPVPVEGCHACAVHAHSRELARDLGAREQVAAASAVIRAHPHSAIGSGRVLPVSTVWGAAV